VCTIYLLPCDIPLPIVQLSVAWLQQLLLEQGEGDVDFSGDVGQGQQRWRTMFGRGGARHCGHSVVPKAGEGELSRVGARDEGEPRGDEPLKRYGV
jgi:hypothetical protein